MPFTTRTSKQHRYQAKRIVTRASTPGGTHHCNVIDCRKPRLQAIGKGVGRYCLQHANHLRRHGHTTRRTFTAEQLGSYRRAAFEWLSANPKDIIVAHAEKAIGSRMEYAGPVVEPNVLVGLNARNRANAVWSRLRRREINPLVILSIAISVEALLFLEPDPPRDRRYARVQMAKVLNRLAGGIVKRWERTSGTLSQEIVAFQQSRGLYLITLGADMEKASELVTDHHLEAILDYHAMRSQKWKKGSVRPYPVTMGNAARKAIVSLFDDGPPPERNPEAPAKEVIEVVTEDGSAMTVVRH